LQLDKTRIAIRERSFPDILDLSLGVWRAQVLPLFMLSLAGALPFALFNTWLTHGLLVRVETWYDWPGWWIFWQFVLVAWEAPLASSLATLYLGQALFSETTSMRRMFHDLRLSLPQLVWYQVFCRGFLIWFLLMIYFFWPYLNEVVLLELNPMFSKSDGRISTAKRASQLHARSFGDLMLRWMCSVFVGVIMITMIYVTITLLRSMLAFGAATMAASYETNLQVAIWSVFSYFTVVRFLSYLDLRIRTEGWEIDLRMRAEAARLARQVA